MQYIFGKKLQLKIMLAILKMIFSFTLFACKRIFSTSLEIEILYCFLLFVKQWKKHTHDILPQIVKIVQNIINHKIMEMERQDLPYE